MNTATRQPAARYRRASHALMPIGGEPTSVSAENIRPGMAVYDYDGVHLGRVKDAHEVAMVVRRRWRGDLSVPLEQVLTVLDGRVVLTIPHVRPDTAGA
jgi:hypothetical protein